VCPDSVCFIPKNRINHMVTCPFSQAINYIKKQLVNSFTKKSEFITYETFSVHFWFLNDVSDIQHREE
jgi:hypothetical protein